MVSIEAYKHADSASKACPIRNGEVRDGSLEEPKNLKTEIV